MIVFKLCMKIINRNKGTIITYLGVFIAIIVIMTNSIGKSSTQFSNVETPVVFIDNDNTALTIGLKTYLDEYAIYKDIKEEMINDAFFYRDIEMIVMIPEGFTDSLLNEDHLNIQTRSVPDSSSSYTFQMAIDKYLNLAYIYLDNKLVEENPYQSIQEILNTEAVADMYEELAPVDYDFVLFYYNYLTYILLALIITVVGSIMMSFKPIEIKRRNNIASISNKKMNLLLLLVNFLLGISFTIILIIVSIILYKDTVLQTNGLLLMLNSFIFTLTVISLAYLIVTLFDSRNVVGALGTICSLGFAFITGVFIPQTFLDKNLLVVARVIPSYWYVFGNNEIVSLSNHSISNMGTVIMSYMIQIIFALVFVFISLFISKKRQSSEN